MMNQAFLSHFKISAQEISNLKDAQQGGQSLIELCLEKKLIDEASYMKWAKDHYGLCILKDDFLNNHNHVETLLNRYKNVFPKSVVPFYEWDGVIYVMCLEPVEFKAPQAIHYILAPNYLLQKFSSLNDSKIQITSNNLEVPENREVTNPLFSQLKSEEPNVLPNFNFQLPDNVQHDLQEDVQSDAIVPPPIEVPEGIDLKKTAIINLSELQPSVESADAKDSENALPEAEPIMEVPQGLNFPPTPDAKPDFAVDRKITSDELILDLSDNLATEEEKEQITKIFDIPMPNQIAPQAVTPAVVPTASLTPIVAGAADPASTNTSPGSELGEFQNLFSQMKKYFSQSMVLSYKNNILAPYKWDSTWSKDPHSQTAIDISIPSIFRIVCETQKPYHGYVIPNPINDSFFTNWNQAKYPEHITLYPVIANKQLVGMVLGATSKENSKSFQLHHIENFANECAQLLTKNQTQAA